jgi:hypothetical protein
VLKEREDEIVVVMVEEKPLAQSEQVKVRTEPQSTKFLLVELRCNVCGKNELAEWYHSGAPFPGGVAAVGSRM